MLPDNTSSSIAIGGVYLPPDDRVTSPLVDYESGGMALLDASAGMFARVWKAWLQGTDVWLQPEGGEAVLLFQEVDITEIALAFDQNMRWAMAYIKQGTLHLRWFDPQINDHIVSTFAQGVNPKMALDDKRTAQLGNSDIILAYIRDSTLYYRQQRDRFGIERVLRTNLFTGTRLKGIGMNKNLRLQFELV